MSGVIIEWAPFRVVEGVSEQQLLLASRDLQEAFLDGRPGFVRRELLRGSEGRWVDLVYWEDERSARAAQEAASASSACQKYFSLMVPEDQEPSAGVLHFQQAANYA